VDEVDVGGAEALLHHTTGLCAVCKASVPAAIWRAGDRVVMRKACSAHGPAEVEVSSNAAWYDAIMAEARTHVPPAATRPVAQGCPFDCGPCASHEQRVHLPVLPITSACNLDCPICYTHNRNEGAYHMGEDELAAILGHLKRMTPERRIVNLTGGEPTMHPHFERLVERCREEGIQRVTISTHGLRFLADEALLGRLAAMDARVVLSFDSFKDEVNQAMLGGHLASGKRRVLELLEKHAVPTTLLPVVARGVNDGELGDFVRLALTKDFVRSLELHTMTFTGQSGRHFDRRARMDTHELLVEVERQSGGQLAVADFVSLPSAHPLCYLVTYLLKLPGGRWLPFPRFMTRADLAALLGDTLYLLPSPEMEERLQDVINRLWIGELECAERDEVLAVLKALTVRLFAPGLSEDERRQIAEEGTKAVYVHAHMDEDTFDTDRIRKCCVGMPGPDGSSIPSCAYNVLYRERDHRFMAEPAAPLVQLGRGRLRA
jgi:uncharacterized radical SAM superfamily Fe-S cluster-containing enzyme